jgi:hypothetical protein
MSGKKSGLNGESSGPNGEKSGVVCRCDFQASRADDGRGSTPPSSNNIFLYFERSRLKNDEKSGIQWRKIRELEKIQ